MPFKNTRVAGKVDMYSLRWLVIGTGTPKRLYTGVGAHDSRITIHTHIMADYIR